MASGLGSVNVANLISNWNSVTFNPTTTTFTLNGNTNAVSITHGQSVAVGATVTPNSGTTNPTGEVVLYTSNLLAPSTLDLYPLSAGQASGSTSSLPGGTSYNVWARYSGDGTFAPSTSNLISVTVGPEPSTTTLSLQASSLTGAPLTSPYPFGSLVFVRADVAGNSGKGIPTGTVTFADSFGPLPTANPQVSPPVQVVSNPTLNSQGNTSIGDGIISFDAGSHTISATYAGDGSFSTSTSVASVTFTVQPGFVGVSGPTDVTITAPGGAGTTTIGIVGSSNLGSAITFTCSGLPAEATCASASATSQGPNTIVNTNIAITTTGPHTVALPLHNGRYYYAVLLAGGFPVVGIFFLGGSRQRRWHTPLALMILMSLLIVIPACGGGGGSSSHHQDAGTPPGTYSVTVTATAGSITQQGTFTLTLN